MKANIAGTECVLHTNNVSLDTKGVLSLWNVFGVTAAARGLFRGGLGLNGEKARVQSHRAP